MILEKIFNVLPFEFYAAVLSATALYLIWMTIQIIITRTRVRRLQKDLQAVENAVAMHQGCHIENLPLISEIFEGSSERLHAAYDKILQVSVDFHQKRWIPNPADFIRTETVLDKKTSKRIKGYGFLYFSMLGFFLVLAVVIAGMFIFSDPAQFNACLLLSLAPLVVCLVFTLLFFIEKLRNLTVVGNTIKSLVQTLSYKLPVFNDYNGLALLINQFLDYDRDMTKAVDRLTDQIDHLVMEGLTNAVTASIEKTLLESVAPSIERATSAIVTLSTDVIAKENSGMKDLALKFSAALSDELTYQLNPLIRQICEVANTLSNSKNYLDIASKSLDTYKQNALDLQSLTSRTLVDYEKSKAMFSEDIHSMASSFAEFSQSTRIYNEQAAANQRQFESAALTLKDSMEEGYKSLRLLLDGVFVEARNAEEQAVSSQKMNENYLAVMKSQIDSFSQEFAARNRELFENFASMTSMFIDRQAEQIAGQQEKIGSHSISVMESMEQAAKDIQASSAQIKSAFDELEAARIREEENAKNKKSGFFGRKG